MRLGFRSVVWLLPLLLCACGHKVDVSQVQPLAPPIDDTPPPKVDSTAAALAAKPVPFPAQPQPTVVVKPQEPPKVPKHKKPPLKTTATPPPSPPPAPTQVASAETPASGGEISALGTLTTGDPDTKKKDATDAINDVEKGINAINRKLSDTEEKTFSQVREYLKQAQTAYNTGDLEGAKTLALKAKVLLSELNQ